MFESILQCHDIMLIIYYKKTALKHKKMCGGHMKIAYTEGLHNYMITCFAQEREQGSLATCVVSSSRIELIEGEILTTESTHAT